jgi:hypothetical protein
MKKETALKVLEEVRAYVGDSDPNHGPQLMDHNHEELSEGSWSICYEGGGPEDWAYYFATKYPEVFVEPINSVILGVFDA